MNTLGERHEQNEQRTMFVVAFTAATMVGETIGGTVFGLIALFIYIEDQANPHLRGPHQVKWTSANAVL